MTPREPFKPISIHKKLGEIYFDEKCKLKACEPAPNANFSVETAEAMLSKHKDAKKPVKMKIKGLADSLKLEKGSRLGRKVPYSKIKYSEVKFHKVFAHSKNVLVLGVQGSDNLKKYMVIAFEQPMKAARLDSQLEYADRAPKNNLKSRIPIADTPSVRLPSPEPNYQLSRNALLENEEGSQETPIIQETGLPRANYEMSPQPSVDVLSNRAAESPRQSAHSPSPPLAASHSSSPMRPPSISHTVQSRDFNHSRSETALELANQQREGTPNCSRSGSMREELVNTATSPVKLPAENLIGLSPSPGSLRTTSSHSSSRSRSHSKIFTQNRSFSRSLSRSLDKKSRDNSSGSRRSDSMTSNSSHFTMTTDASSHYILEDGQDLHDHWPRAKEEQMVQQQHETNLINSDTVVVRDDVPAFMAKPHRRRSSSSSRLLKQKKSKSKREHRPKSMVATSSSAIQIDNPSPKSGNANEPLFILATGKFKPFSEFSHEHSADTHGICSICGKEGGGDHRQVEIIRTDSKGGPVISDDGCVYMYSTTRPVEYTNDNGIDKKKKHSREHKSRSSSSSSSSSNRGSQMEVAPASIYPNSQKTDVHMGAYTNGKKKSTHNSSRRSSSISRKTRSEPRNLVSTVPIYQRSKHPDSEIVEIYIPSETQHSHGRRKSHRNHSRHRNPLSEAEVRRSADSVIYQEVPLASERYGTHGHRRSSTSSTKNKIYRLESSDSDSSSLSTEESDPHRPGAIKVTPLHY
ncbi:hypothetical protein Aperf_G00000036827 [Anoplocephala perfoliata]